MAVDVPRVGVGVFVLGHGGKFVMGVRKGSLGSGTLALPGGHLDFGESFEECAAREVMEETGLKVQNVYFLTAVNSVLEKERKHYITIFMVAEASADQEPQLMEPNKCEGWFWVTWEQMKSWAVSELSDHRLDAAAAVDGKSENGQNLPVKLFLPLLNLTRERPEISLRPLAKR